MFIAVMSDLHDNVADWDLMVKILSDRNIRVLINCGDTVAPSMLQRISQTFAGQIHTVFGNNADRDLETQVAQTLTNVTHHGDRGGVDLADTRIGFVHYPEVAEAMAATGEFDLVCHGHSHLKRWEMKGACRLLNPGTAGGMFGYPSFALVEVLELRHEFVDLKL